MQLLIPVLALLDVTALSTLGETPSQLAGVLDQDHLSEPGSEACSGASQDPFGLIDDRKPAKRLPVGTVLAWDVPSVFNASSVFSVLSKAPISNQQWVTVDEGVAAALGVVCVDKAGRIELESEQDEKVQNGEGEHHTSSADQPQVQDAALLSSSNTIHTEVGDKGNAHQEKTESIAASSAVDDGDWPKRTALPILQFYDENGAEILLADDNGDVDAASSVETCRPRDGLTLVLEGFLAEGTELPTQIFRCTIQPTGHDVLLRLLTDQANQQEPDVYVPKEVYEDYDFDKVGLGETAQGALSRESDAFKSLETLQGRHVPYSYGFYPASAQKHRL